VLVSSVDTWEARASRADASVSMRCSKAAETADTWPSISLAIPCGTFAP
jgi:hypothetical protein